MSSQGDEQRCSGEPGIRREHEEKEEDFYDCQETLEPPDPRGEEEEEGTRQDALGSKYCHIKTKRLTDRKDDTETEIGGGGLHQEEAQGNRLQEEAQGDRLQEEEQGDRLQEEAQGDRLQEDSESEMKEENNQAVEFDDDYLREVEKELTEEEKESRQQQSLTLKEKGNSQFKAGDWLEAERSYTEALVLCPVCFSRERAVLFSNRAAARLHLDLKDQAISDCTRAIELNPDYVRALLRRAELYEQTEKLDEALEDYKKVLDQDPNQTSARQACMRLPQQIQERNEKLKEEMISKLKDLGNMILRPFGLSTNNFQVNQDQDTGSYSINFVQKPNNNR
uniref:Tetratricopeptide repeat protein 1 n=2 Tax=Seriola dumerili TaxID=41447 RepID=A0A3B4VR39_SERDU